LTVGSYAKNAVGSYDILSGEKRRRILCMIHGSYAKDPTRRILSVGSYATDPTGRILLLGSYAKDPMERILQLGSYGKDPTVRILR